MKIFFSYGHDHKTGSGSIRCLLEQLKEDIEIRKHHIFLDEFGIHPGEDWRSSIMKGLSEADLIFFFADRKSVQQSSVCRDELNIGLNAKGVQVQVIRLEKELTLPSEISFLQQIDLSDWKEKTEDSRWYSDKLTELLNSIRNQKKHLSELKKIRTVFCPDFSLSKKKNTEDENYTHRDWLLDQIICWKRNKESRVLLMTGYPGTGKSSFVANELADLPNAGAVIYCKWDDHDSGTDLRSITNSLIYQFSCSCPDYCHAIAEKIRKPESWKDKKDEEFYRTMINEVFRNLINADRPEIIVMIDALDEVRKIKNTGKRNSAENRENSALLKIIGDAVCDSSTPWLRYIVTSRPEPEILSELSLAERIDLSSEENQGNNYADVQKYITFLLSGQYDAEAIEKLCRAAAGNFLYASIACRMILKDHFDVTDIINDTGRNSGTGRLEYLYMKYMQRRFAKEEYPLFCRAWSALCYTREPLPETTLRAGMQWDQAALTDFEDRMSDFIESEDGRLSYFHKSFVDWLTSRRTTAKQFSISRQEGQQIIADGCYLSYKKNPDRMNEYEALWLIRMLKETDDQRSREVLQDADFGALLLERGNRTLNASRLERAESYFEDARDVFASCGLKDNFRMLGSACRHLIETYDRENKLIAGKDGCTEGIRFMRQAERELTPDEQMQQAEIQEAEFHVKKIVLLRQADRSRGQAEEYTTEIRRECDDAVRIYRKYNQQEKIVEVLHHTAKAFRMAYNHIEAKKYFGQIWGNPYYQEMVKMQTDEYAEILLDYSFYNYDIGEYEVQGKALDACAAALESKINNPKKAQLELSYHYQRCLLEYGKKDFRACIRYAEQAVKEYLQYYGPSCRDVTSAMNQMGSAYLRLGGEENIQKAFSIYRESIEIRKNSYGMNNRFTLTSMRNLARALENRKDPEEIAEAEEILQNVLQGRLRLKEQKFTAMAYVDLAEFNLIHKKPQETVRYMDLAMETYNGQAADSDLCKCNDFYGRAYFELKDYINAKKYLTAARDLQEKYYRAGVKRTEEMLQEIEKRMEKAR